MCEEEEVIRWIFLGGMGDTVDVHELICDSVAVEAFSAVQMGGNGRSWFSLVGLLSVLIVG
jgi:hypothetical protein